MKMERLPKSSITIWRLRLTIATCALVFLLGILVAFFSRVAVFLLLVTFFSYMYLFIFYCIDRYNNECFFIDSSVLYVERGVYFKTKKNIFLDKLQYIKIIVSPDQKIFGLCTMCFFSIGSKTIISHLEYKRALAIKKALNLGDINEI